LSHFPLSEAEAHMLPKRVPWLLAKPEVQAQLDALRIALVVPLERRGLICVDFADLVVVLANGGEARLTQASGKTASLAFDGLFTDKKLHEWLSAPNVAACLHIRANPGFTMSDLDLAGHRLDSLLAEESYVVISARAWNGDEAELTLLTVARR